MDETNGSAPLLSRNENGILWLTLNRPEAHNAFTVPMMEGLRTGFKEAEKDPAIRVVILTGAGRAFCAGQDLREHTTRSPNFVDELRDRYNPLMLQVRNLPKPVIAAVNGVAAGAGMSLALACDFRICTSETKFFTSFVKIGLVPDSGNLFWLGQQIGFSRALELEMTGRPVSAEEALQWGLVNRIVPADRLLTETAEFAKLFVEGPTLAFALTKQLFHKSLFAKDLPSLFDQEALLQEVAGRTQDHREGLTAFMEKRAPKFTGK
ncbi:MAG: enoyl-CoA hydratase/isomerase family protein [Elusimicrobia bacterium]|nr:enoyl-CoA hydratase/isomerase family protein [Elusimicrobiota bacterium]